MQAAYEFNLKHAARFDSVAITSAGASGSSGISLAVPDAYQWLTVRSKLKATLSRTAVQSKKAAVRAFDLELPITEKMRPGGVVRFPIVPGAATNQLSVTLPEFGFSAKSLPEPRR